MRDFFRVVSVSAFALLAASVTPRSALAQQPQFYNPALTSVINNLSTPLTSPITFPLLNAEELFSQDDPRDVEAIEQVFSAYVFYNDSHNGPGLASLYLPNGVDDHGYNNGSGVIVPSYGIGGHGCVSTGTQQIATYISDIYGNTAVLPYPDHTHHVATSKLVKVAGNDAMMQVVWYAVINTAAPPTFSLGGEYLVTFKRTPSGWMIRTNHVIFDQPETSVNCDLTGPIPRTVP